MKHEDGLKLIELMTKLGFERSAILLTLINCETGMGIGHALDKALKDIVTYNE